MEHDEKQTYLDKLKNIQGFPHESVQYFQKDIGILNDDSSCFNENHQEHIEPIYGSNDLFAQVQRYIKANPSRYTAKNRLTMKNGLNQHGLQSSIQYKNNFVTSYGLTSHGVNFVRRKSLIKPHHNIVNYEPDSKINIGLPNASSTSKHQQTKNISRTQKQSVEPKIVYKNNTFGSKSERNDQEKPSSSFNNYFSSSETSPSKIIKRNVQEYSKTKSDIKLNKNLDSTIEGKAKLNVLPCLYLEFIHSNFNGLKSIMDNDNINNDYSENLINKIKQIQLKSQNVRNTNLTNSTGSVFKETPIDSFINKSSRSISNNRNFIFKPDINLFYSPGKPLNKTQFSQDSFICSGPEFSIIKMEDSNNIDIARLESNEEFIFSPDIFENTRNYYSKKKRKSSNEQELSTISQGSFKYYRRKMF